jgi:cyclase
MYQRGQTRRQLLKSAIGAAGIALGAPVLRLAAQGPGASAQTLKLADDLFLVTMPGETNVLAQTTNGGALLVDGMSARASDALMAVIAGLPGSGPVHTLFNTHWHSEQTGSNQAVGKAGKTIIAQENTRLWLTTDVKWPWNGNEFKRLPKIAQPNKTFYKDGTLESGIKYGHIPDAAHTDGDLYVFFSKQNVLAVGDVMSGQGWPVVDYVTGGWIGGIVGGLQRLQTIANDDTRIVPGRGPVLGMKELKAQSDMYGTIYDRLSTMLNRGRGPSEAVAAQPAKEFEAQMGNADEFIRRSFESLWAYLSPDA